MPDLSAHHYYVNDDADPVEITDRIQFDSWELTEHAEESSVGTSSIIVDDPDMDLDEIRGHRTYYVIEDASGDDEMVYLGFFADQTIERGMYRVGREWHINVVDANSVIDKRIMTGSSSNRPAETDVERILWLITTSEGHGLDHTSAWVSTANPVNMDACDYRGQRLSNVIDDCAQASGKNHYAFWDDDYVNLWYGAQDLTTRSSTLSLSNDLAEIDGETIFAISEDTKLTRDPSRVYSGVYLPYDGGAVYKQASFDETIYTWRRDSNMPSLNVKTAAKANARADRYLIDLADQELRIDTTVIVPNTAVNELRAGMRVLFRATHFTDGLDVFTWCLILSRTVKAWTHDQYMVTMTLSPGPPGPSCAVAASTAVGTYITDQPYSTGTYSISLTPGVSSAVMAGFMVENWNIPTASFTSSTGLNDSALSTISEGFFVAGWNHTSGGVLSPSVTYYGGYGNFATEGAVIAALPTSATSPTQVKQGTGAATFDATPAVGSLIAVVLFGHGYGVFDHPESPADGWTLLQRIDWKLDFAAFCMGIWVRCYQDGDTLTYGNTTGTGGKEILLAEWPIT